MKKILLSVLFLIFIISGMIQSYKNKNQENISAGYFDPFVETGEQVHAYPEAMVSFEMLQFSPDNSISNPGFNHLYLSETGSMDLSGILFMPANKKVDLAAQTTSRDQLPYKSFYSHANEKSISGYYQVFLEDPKINVELTFFKRTAYYKDAFAKNDRQSVCNDQFG